jgi:hypothetical protein
MNKRNNKPELIIREREDPFKKDLLDSISALKEAIGLLTSEVQQLRATILMNGLDRISDKQKDTITQPTTPSNPLLPYYTPTTPYPSYDPNYFRFTTEDKVG